MVTYKGGDQIGLSYVYDDTRMISGKTSDNRCVYNEFEIKGDMITQLSGHYYQEEGQGRLYRTTYNLKEGTTEERVWKAFNTSDSDSHDSFKLTAGHSYLG
jgi:hypothetical protein